ncbi:MAG: ankyrin repeat and protein mask-like isoform [Rickettsiaceae bacterium]|jgi:ankyrin repeat protein|nr:ankyrin repeat and protein mask-like isoform [Rickettsiaceae bacterium]
MNEGKREREEGEHDELPEGKKPKLESESNVDNSHDPLALLKTAINNDDVDALKQAISLGANINQEFIERKYPQDYHLFEGPSLHYAAYKGKLDIIKYLIELGMEVDLNTSNEVPPLIYAAAQGHYEIVKFLLDKGANPNYELDVDGANPLSEAAENGHASVVELLLKAGANANGPLKNSKIPLVLAAENGHISVVELLIKAGADLNPVFAGTNTPLTGAITNAHPSIVELLLKAGADLNITRGDTEDPPLVLAMEEAYDISIIEALLKAGADINKTYDDYNTPLIRAAHLGFVEVVKLFIDNIFNLGKQNDKDLSIQLILATRIGNVEAVKFLLDKGVNPNRVYVLEGGYIPMVKQEDGELKYVTILRDDRSTPLIIATQEGHVKIVKELLKTNEIDLYHRDKAFKNAFDYAKAEVRLHEIARTLELYKTFKAILNDPRDKKALFGLLNPEEDKNFIKDLTKSYFYNNNINKLSVESVNSFISKLELNAADFTESTEIALAKDFNLILREVRNDLLKEYKEFRDDLFTLETHIVATYDPKFTNIIMQNSITQEGGVGYGFKKTQLDDCYFEGESFLGLIGRRVSKLDANKYEGEQFGQGVILQKFIGKLQASAIQLIDIIKPMLLNKEIFSNFCSLFDRIKHMLPREEVDKVKCLTKEVTKQQSKPVTEILENILEENDNLIKELNAAKEEQEHLKHKIQILEKQLHSLQEQGKVFQKSKESFISFINKLIKENETGSIDCKVLEKELSKLFNLNNDTFLETVSSHLEMVSENDGLFSSLSGVDTDPATKPV